MVQCFLESALLQARIATEDSTPWKETGENLLFSEPIRNHDIQNIISTMCQAQSSFFPQFVLKIIVRCWTVFLSALLQVQIAA